MVPLKNLPRARCLPETHSRLNFTSAGAVAVVQTFATSASIGLSIPERESDPEPTRPYKRDTGSEMSTRFSDGLKCWYCFSTRRLEAIVACREVLANFTEWT